MKNFLATTNSFVLIIQANSPGEISNWAIPFARLFKKNVTTAKIILAITPCQYASKNEKEVALHSQVFDQVYAPKETIKLIFSWPLVTNLTSKKGAVLSLGGDPFYSKLLGLKFHLPVFVYTERKKFKSFLIKEVFSKYEIGDLMYEKIKQIKDSLSRDQILKKYNLQDQKYCLFFAGSRPQHFTSLLPHYLELVKIVKNKHPDFKAILQVSPFITDKILTQIKKEINLDDFIVLRGNSLELISISSLLLTIPSTSTSEAMYLGLPMIVVLPTNKADLIIFDGLLGLVGNLPILGTILKKIVIAVVTKVAQKRLFALPNIMAQKEVVPELKGHLTAEFVAEKVCELFYNEAALDKIKKELALIPIKEDTAQLMMEKIKS
ncbi:MAG: hypothetical protein WC860_08160 [Candidatus Margulisiibacteriota bacterium]|jgi:lipid-A-disaccharide synthase